MTGISQKVGNFSEQVWGISVSVVTVRVSSFEETDDSAVGEFHDMERVGDLDGVRQHRVEHAVMRTRQIQRRPPDLGTPLFTARPEPRCGSPLLCGPQQPRGDGP